MAAVLTPAEYEYARTLAVHEIPNRLRCAKCNKPVFEAMKTDCCDTSICKSCSEKLSKACPACSHPITSDMTREDKRTRVTLKAHIKGELQKRNNAQVAAAAAAAEVAQSNSPEKRADKDTANTLNDTPSGVDQPRGDEQISGNVSADLAEEATRTETHAEDDQDPDADADDDDRSSVEIITEVAEDKQYPSSHDHQSQEQTEEAHGEEQDDGDTHLVQGHDAQMNGFGNTDHSNFNNNPMGNFGGMAGFNPMMAMQAGMGMPPFGMMPGMMGMPNMGMDPSMMFNGGFAGMNGMAQMMNGNMMGGNFGMGDMNDFTSYNHQYGNRYDDRSHGQSFFPSNRGYGRGNYNQNYRGRGQGFYNRGGRGRGGWNNQYQGHNNYHQHHQQQQQHTNYPQSQGHVTQQQDEYSEATTGANGDVAGDSIENGNVQAAVVDDEEKAEVDSHNQQPGTAPQIAGEYVEDEVDYDDDDVPGQPDNGASAHHSNANDDTQGGQAHAQQQATRVGSPPVNAPTGPKAMREGFPNNGRYSRPQTGQFGREVSNERGAMTASEAVAAPRSSSMRPGSSRSYADRDKSLRHRETAVHEREGSHQRNSRAVSRSPSARHESKRKKHGSRREDEDRYHDRERYDQEQSVDDESRSKRKDRKQEREYDDDKAYREKKRSRSASADDSASRRHRSHREDKDRSRRDRSREKHKSSSHRDREYQDSADEADHYRHRTKSHKSSRRERDEHEGQDSNHDRRGGDASRSARPALLEEHPDDIGFRIKGSKSRESKNQNGAGSNAGPPNGPAGHRDPYAEERERMKEQRLQRDAQRRQSTQTSSKRSRDDNEEESDTRHSRKKRSRPRAKYEDEIENHERERESRRWR